MAKTKAITRYRSRPKRKRRRKNGFTIPLTLVAPMAGVAGTTYNDYKKHGLSTAMKFLGGNLTGFAHIPGQPIFDAGRLKYGLLPILAGAGFHKLAGKLGINRALANAGVPWIRI